MKSLEVEENLLKQIIFSKQSLITDVITQQYIIETCKCKNTSCRRKFSIQQCKNSAVKYRFFVGDSYVLSLNTQNKIQEGFVIQFTYEHGSKCVKKINIPLQFNIDQIVMDILKQSFHFLDFESPKQQLQALIKYHDIYDLKHDSIKSFGLAGTEFFIYVMRESFPFIYIEDSEITNILIRNKVKVLPTAIYEFGDEEFTMKNILLEYLSMQYDQNAFDKIKEFKQQIQNQQNNTKNINNDKKSNSFDQISLNLYDLSQFQLNQEQNNQQQKQTNQSLRSVLSELKKKQQTINIKMVKVDTSTYYIQSDTFINSSPFNSILNVLIKTLNQFKCARFNVTLSDELEKDFGRLLNVLKHNNIQDLTQKILELSQFDAVFSYSNVTTGAYELLCKYLAEDFVNESIVVFDPQQPPEKFLKQQEQKIKEQNDSHLNKSNIQNDLKMIQQNSIQQQQQQQLNTENNQQNKKYSIFNEDHENKEDILLKELPKCQAVSLKSSSKSNNQQQLDPVNSVIASLHETSMHNRQIVLNNLEQQSNELLFVNNNSTQKSNNSINNQMFPQQMQTVNQQLGYQILPAQQLPYVAQQYPSPNYIPNNFVGLSNMQYQQPIPPQNMYYPQNMYPQPQFVQQQMQYMNPNYYQQLSNINQPNFMQPPNYMFQQPQMSQPQLTPIYPPGYEPSQSQQYNPSGIMYPPVMK
ncbi:Hypothetical_protein [Hexamita inflata]|uniref:Hypothetical_protein n=1 Tax=Hexamita inflata TaxID=28002 RepID=A0AA86QLW1_9EUKA|nr:Hypothetical protein HINF_LOCUS19856 [Hexamita inflata]CAI9961979.1 Hypothetical protein HINF_LOCUS49624 [Hexamita inflata]